MHFIVIPIYSSEGNLRAPDMCALDLQETTAKGGYVASFREVLECRQIVKPGWSCQQISAFAC